MLAIYCYEYSRVPVFSNNSTNELMFCTILIRCNYLVHYFEAMRHEPQIWDTLEFLESKKQQHKKIEDMKIVWMIFQPKSCKATNR
jgi:hypothetical protein